MPALKPYPEYKDSGMRWMGAVPEHWNLRRIRNVVDMRVSNVDKHTKEGELPVRLCNYIDVYKNDRITEGISFMRATATAEEIENFHLEPNDVLITKDSEVWDDIGIPALVEYTAQDLICGYHLALLRPRELLLNGAYLLRALQSPIISYQFHIAANGVTRYGLSHNAIKSVILPIPPLSEQSTIVSFFDHVDRRIRRYIRAKQRLIKLLEEQKQAIIHRAVTRGLDPSVPLKPSGVEWLGDIPEHWDVSRIKTEFQCLNYRRVPLSGTDRGKMTLRRYDYYGASGVIDKVDDYLFDDELLLIAEDGANLVLRNLPLAIIARGKFWVNNHAHILKPTHGNLEYLAAVMESLNYMPWISGAAQPKLTQERLMSISISVPPRDEQNVIIAFLQKENGPRQAAIDHAYSEISLLREYRARLISDVVTGKLDVRGVNLPAEDVKAAEEYTDLSDSEAFMEDEELQEEIPAECD